MDRMTGPAAAVVVGRPQLICDLIRELLRADSIDVLPADDGNGNCTFVLVNPEPDDWQQVGSTPTGTVCVTSAHLTPSQVAATILAGADAIVPTSASGLELHSAFGAVASGLTRFDPRDARTLIDEVRKATRSNRSAGGSPVDLSAREVDVLRSIERGESMKQTARTLGISVRTVENTRARLFKKLNCRNSAHAMSRAHQLGLSAAV